MSSPIPMAYGAAYTLSIGSLQLSHDDLRKWVYLYETGIPITFVPTTSTSTQIMNGDVVKIKATITGINYMTLPGDGSDYVRWSLVVNDSFTIVSPPANVPPAPGSGAPIDVGAAFSLLSGDGSEGQIAVSGLYLVFSQYDTPATFVATLFD